MTKIEECKKIGDGSYGDVYRIKLDGETYALKCSSVLKNTDGTENLGEIDMLIRCCHPFIVHLFGKPHINTDSKFSQLSERPGERLDRTLMILEWCQYKDVANYIDNVFPKRGQRAKYFATIKLIFLETALALDYLHQNNIMHLDIKPSNILIKNIDPVQIRLCDFGFTTFVFPYGRQSHNVVTHPYRAPEIVDHRRYDVKSDVWSLGILALEFIMGDCPFSGIDDDPDELRKYINGLLNKGQKDDGCPSLGDYISSFGDIKKFNQSAGNFDLFHDIIQKCLVEDPRKRWTVSEILDHEFFDDYREFINNDRNDRIPIAYCLPTPKSPPFIIEQSIDLLKSKDRSIIKIITPRVIFHGIDIFNRSYDKKYEMINHFISSIYIAVKYFNVLHVCAADQIAIFFGKALTTNDIIEIEDYILKKLNYQIFNRTPFEMMELRSLAKSIEEMKSL